MLRLSCSSDRSLTWPAQGPGTNQARYGSVYNKRLGMVPRYTGYVPRKSCFLLQSLAFKYLQPSHSDKISSSRTYF